MMGSSATPSTWHCIVTAVPDGRDQPPPAVPAGPRPPCRRERDGARERDEVRVPDEGRLVDRSGRDRHDKSGHEPGDRPRHRPRPATTPPRPRRSRPGRSGRRRRTASRRRSAPRPATAGSSTRPRDGNRRSRSAGRGVARPRHAPVPGARACRGPGRHPTSRGWRGSASRSTRGEEQETRQRQSLGRSEAVGHAGAIRPTGAAGQLERLRWQRLERLARPQRARPIDVDRVVADVHARCLEDVRRVRQTRMAQDVGEALGADPPRHPGARADPSATRAPTACR